MKKTFDQLLPGDKVYRVWPTEMHYTEEVVHEVEKEKVSYNTYSDPLIRINKTSQEIDGAAWFSNKPDAIRYAKAQMIKRLHIKINEAKKSIERVKDFRKEHYDKLNLDWTDKEINKLEKELAY